MNTTTRTLLIAAVIAAVGIPIALRRSHAEKSLPPPNPAEAKAKAGAPRVVPQSQPALPSGEERRHYRPPPVSREVSQEVEAILRRFRGLSKPELMNSPELNNLENRFIKVISAPEMQVKVAQRIAALHAVGKPGTLTMAVDLLDKPAGRAWLEAVVSNDEQSMKDWLFNTLDGAIFEFALDPTLNQTSDGVKIKPSPPEPPSPDLKQP